MADSTISMLRYMTWTGKVGGSSPSVDMIRSAQLGLRNPVFFQGDCPLLSLINCKSLWLKALAK